MSAIHWKRVADAEFARFGPHLGTVKPGEFCPFFAQVDLLCAEGDYRHGMTFFDDRASARRWCERRMQEAGQ